jgi:hypothetical protein
MSAHAVQQIFDMLWDRFVKIVAKPVVVKSDDVLDLVDSVYDELARSAKKLCDNGKVIPFYFAHYVFEASLPTKDDINYEFFGLVDEECETDDMDEFMECVNKVYDCIRLAQQFFNTLPQLLTVEVIQDG